MGDDLVLISDDDGLAVIGESKAVERFLGSEGLVSKDRALPHLGPTFGAVAGVAQAGSEASARLGRWVKLTKESAKDLKKYGLTDTKTPGLSYAMLGKRGSIKKWLKIEKGPASILTNPAALAGVAGIMAQASMQQAMEEITDYLAAIDQKVDDILRAQKDAVVADMIGVDILIDEAMTIREHVGRVSEVTWSKVQSEAATIARTQAYALRQLDALVEKVEQRSKVSDIAKAVKEAESKSQEWLAVLARCFQLQDAIAVLELDRVLDASPDELDRHRLALRVHRQERLALISRATERLLDRMDAAAGIANQKVLANPIESPAVVKSSNQVVLAVAQLHERLGLEPERPLVDVKPWLDAAADVKDRVIEAGADGAGAALRFGGEALSRARSVADRVSSEAADRAARRHDGGDPPVTPE